MRIFVDANVVISALLFPGGKVAQVFAHVLENHTAIISSYTKNECAEVFSKKFPEKSGLLDNFFDGISYEEFESPAEINTLNYPKIRDVKDLPVLASAILSDSDVLLTGDKDFCDVHIDKPLVFTPAQYYELISP